MGGDRLIGEAIPRAVDDQMDDAAEEQKLLSVVPKKLITANVITQISVNNSPYSTTVAPSSPASRFQSILKTFCIGSLQVARSIGRGPMIWSPDLSPRPMLRARSLKSAVRSNLDSRRIALTNHRLDGR